MPLALIVVLMVGLWAGSLQLHTHASQIEIKEASEAKSIATNMVNFRRLIYAYAFYKDSGGNTPNLAMFQAFHGDARAFLQACQTAGHIPQVMTWYDGPAPGVTATITGGRIQVDYTRTALSQPPDAGVQTAYRQMTRSLPQELL